ncbi:Cell division protein DamX, binds to the septal ring, contains C-terminal SPOR domain [Arsukibacterium tuosuense]|uniref:Cell division protein DamX, binds to the septal ring, contains C-terminal SPOR domain n=1 Tax=Arsukibacterium tuosuense TaxID=1323745 RepID=A0A285JBX5_9GAMM|nr:hypothetical protein [Arsukibacterium tuosuense]SNY57748.1 Cell division protein DamX, binds to the septal ring, contains C-terminal SPOR domain [Arsukibacterium tuosuense]
MDTTVLQQKLAELRHLLPSQHELLNRLLFQLAFNDFQNIGLVGGEGSGKSTLALALAELFSEHANVALLSEPVTEAEMEGQLKQHWFGQRQPEPALAALMAEPPADSLPLLLIVDNFNLLSSSARQRLLQLNCLGFFMLAEPSADMALNLSINIPTLQDAGQVLKDKALDPLAVAERFAASAGNMHLLHSALVKSEDRKTHAASWLLPAAIMLLVLVAAISWWLPTSTEQTRSDTTAKTNAVQHDDQSESSSEPADSPEPLDSSERVNTPEQTNSPESEDVSALFDSPEVITGLELTLSAAQDGSSAQDSSAEPVTNPESVDSSELPESMQQQARSAVPDLTETAESQQGSTEAIAESSRNAEQQVVSKPADTSSSTSITAAAIPAAGSLYQEPQLLALPAESRVLQLAVLSSETALQRFARSYPDTDIMVYQRSWQGQLQWIILNQDHYPDISSARQAMASLPESLRAAGPFIKPVGQVQQEIKALARNRAATEVQE